MKRFLPFPNGVLSHLSEGGGLIPNEAVSRSQAQGLRGLSGFFPSNSFLLYFLSDMKRGLF